MAALPVRLLPRYVALKNMYNKKYLRYTHEDIQQHGLFQFTGEEAVSPYTKFEIEPSKTFPGLVNVRCSYNNKYWVRRSEKDEWISGGADVPEEDTSKWSCTLFKPVFLDQDGDQKITLRFLHVQLNHFACLYRSGPPFGDFMYAGWKEPNSDLCDVFEILDLDSRLVLPKHVAFKGDNGMYLGRNGDHYLEFSGRDIGNSDVGNKVLTNPDGSIQIKSETFNQFWRRSTSDWIWADTSDTNSDNPDALFWPHKVVDSTNVVVALRNYGNRCYCKRFTIGGITSCLNAALPIITNEAQLEVEEMVLSRSIDNVDFHLLDARIYDKSVVDLATEEIINNTTKPRTETVKLIYTDSRSSTWNSTVSLKLSGVKTAIQSDIPLIVDDDKIEISGDQLSGEYTWGQAYESSKIKEVEYQFTVDAMSSARVTISTTRGSCDIPFSYTQKDLLIMDGTQVTYPMQDGIYTGTNFYNIISYNVDQQKL